MSWYIVIKTDKVINEPDIEKIINKLPDKVKGKLYFNRKDNCKWVLDVGDVFKPENNSITLHGAYGNDHRDLFESFIVNLCRLGYKIIDVDESF